jgi:hypothetical protein
MNTLNGPATTNIRRKVNEIVAEFNVMQSAPVSYLAPSLHVGIYGTPVLDTAVVDNIAFTINLETATNKTVADTSCMAGYFGVSNSTDTIHNKMQGLLVSTTLHGDVFDAYGIQGHIGIHAAMDTHAVNAHLTGISGKLTTDATAGAGQNVWASAGLFILEGASAITGYHHGVAIVSEVGVTTADAMLFLQNNANSCPAIEFSGIASSSLYFNNTAVHAMKFAASDKTNGAYVATITFDATADGMIKIDVAGTDYYIPFWNAAGLDNEWAD